MFFRKDYINFHDEYAVTMDNTLKQTYSYLEPYYHFNKRLIDVMLALSGLILTCPIVVLFCIAIKIETPGPALYLQERVGRNGRYFYVIKLRSMGVDAEKKGAQWAEKNDPRITKIGSFLRKTRIDEIPQLVNVLLGDMSLVGPRPERPMFTAQFNEEIPGFVKRLAVKPGLTGWAQVNGGYEITPKEKLTHDLYYIENQSFKMDLKILLKTVRIVLTGEGAR